ncbi:MAG: universal stress protein [Thermomicrobiales bacterium]|jgi:nucleotide-binding universal stress UspA family protein|nr:MAG: universal stress protein [Thermomicrobiales bacterium]
MEALPEPQARRVLLAVDLTNASRGAIDEAIRRAVADRAALVVFSVVERSNLHLPGGTTRRVDQERDRLEAGVREIVLRARQAGVAATYLIWEGDPAESIIEASITEEADLIVLGSRRRTDLRRLLLGSVSSEVTRAAPCPVIVVPA